MKRVDPTEFNENFVELVSKQWMLVSAGNREKYNTMTASWGGIGFLWNRPVAFVFIRPERYTHEFIEETDQLTLSFYPKQYKNALTLLGKKSGRDSNKIEESGLTPEFTQNGNPYFKEARILIECKKLFKTPINPDDFIEKDIVGKWYGEKGGFHDMYIVEIENLFVND